MTEEEKIESEQVLDGPFEGAEVDESEPQEEVLVVDVKKEKLSSRENFLNFLTENKERNKQGLK